MSQPQTIEHAAEQAFTSGLYCAESVVHALAAAYDIDSPLLPKAATAFCSGMARTCGTCGALTGGILGISMLLGRDDPGQPVAAAYQATQELVTKFESAFGSKNCHELLGCDIGTPAGQEKFKRENLSQACKRYSAKAAQLAAQAIDVHLLEPLNNTADTTRTE